MVKTSYPLPELLYYFHEIILYYGKTLWIARSFMWDFKHIPFQKFIEWLLCARYIAKHWEYPRVWTCSQHSSTRPESSLKNDPQRMSDRMSPHCSLFLWMVLVPTTNIFIKEWPEFSLWGLCCQKLLVRSCDLCQPDRYCRALKHYDLLSEGDAS